MGELGGDGYGFLNGKKSSVEGEFDASARVRVVEEVLEGIFFVLNWK